MEENNEILKNKENSINPEIDAHNSHSVQPDKLGLGQKVAVFFLVIFAVAAISMWASQFKKNLTSPLANKENNLENLTINQENDEEALKTKDSDGDGLTDWDELYVYNTSPYLEDSDSDGFTDKNEIESENDPNCPSGRDCYGVNVNENINTEKEILSQLDILDQLTIEENEDNLNDVLSGQVNAESLRNMLIEAGMDKEILSQISDEDLLKSYQEILNK